MFTLTLHVHPHIYVSHMTHLTLNTPSHYTLSLDRLASFPGALGNWGEEPRAPGNEAMDRHGHNYTPSHFDMYTLCIPLRIYTLARHSHNSSRLLTLHTHTLGLSVPIMSPSLPIHPSSMWAPLLLVLPSGSVCPSHPLASGWEEKISEVDNRWDQETKERYSECHVT